MDDLNQRAASVAKKFPVTSRGSFVKLVHATYTKPPDLETEVKRTLSSKKEDDSLKTPSKPIKRHRSEMYSGGLFGGSTDFTKSVEN